MGLAEIKQSISTFSSKEKGFILAAMICVFCICADYSIIRPVSNSLFIHAYTSQWFPYAWMATIPLNFLIISLYNRYLPRWGVKKMFCTIAASIIISNVFLGFYIKTIAGLPFCFYLWKEIYILLMLQQIWSIINTSVDNTRSKYLYGIIYGVGGLGGVFGSSISGFLAVKIGSENLLFSTLPLYIILLIAFRFLFKQCNADVLSMKTKETPPFWEGLKLLRESRSLIFILLIVLAMQLSSTLIDFQFQKYLEQAITDKDVRTGFSGQIMGLVNTLSLGLQFVGTFLLVHFLGMRLSHLIVPVVLGLNAIVFLFFPLFGVATFSFATMKTCEFSLFNILREMLYIPLSVKEKFQAKPVIDVFAYRSAKSLASLIILSLQFFAATYLLSVITWGLIVVFAVWCGIVTFFFKKYVRPTA